MPTMYTRTVSLKESLSDKEVVEYWRTLLNETVPMMTKVPGIRGIKCYSGAGALRADITVQIEMDDVGAYERLIADPAVGKVLPQVYGAWDMRTAGQSFRREITPALIQALSGG
jgi:hypothetical protein